MASSRKRPDGTSVCGYQVIDLLLDPDAAAYLWRLNWHVDPDIYEEVVGVLARSEYLDQAMADYAAGIPSVSPAALAVLKQMRAAARNRRSKYVKAANLRGPKRGAAPAKAGAGGRRTHLEIAAERQAQR